MRRRDRVKKSEIDEKGGNENERDGKRKTEQEATDGNEKGIKS